MVFLVVFFNKNCFQFVGADTHTHTHKEGELSLILLRKLLCVTYQLDCGDLLLWTPPQVRCLYLCRLHELFIKTHLHVPLSNTVQKKIIVSQQQNK